MKKIHKSALRSSWDHLRVLTALSQAGGSVDEASRLLDMSPATVYRRIKESEESLDAGLFKRIGNELRLTEVGQQLFGVLERVVEEVSCFRRLAGDGDGQQQGSVSVSLPEIVGAVVLPAIEELLRSRPDMTISLDSTPIGQNKWHGDADCVIAVTENPPEHWVGKEVAEFAVGIYASDKYQTSERALPRCDWMDWESPWSLHDRWDESLAQSEALGTCDNAIVQREALRAGLGVGPLPCVMGEMDPLLRRMSDVPTTVVGKVWVLVHPDVRFSCRVGAMRDALVVAFKKRKHWFTGESPPLGPTAS